MFSSNKKEPNVDESKVNDIEPEVFMELLRYIYTGRVEKFDQLAVQIFKAAHFYEMYDLKLICEHVLMKNLPVTNVIESLKLADDYDGKEIKEQCIAFVLQNFKTVTKSAEIKRLIKTHPHLPFELLIEMGSK
ncbi:speckle-type POZ protein-like [Belonocnema kinseyi]|uniref:speckle-type POZ protein-like n=1 Tax=Belonocnema kinseyi TaxID=2817044 RepID=UPI00143CC5C4|nr:speckle-type POZ protein-like [Belonocnema kinseyi]